MANNLRELRERRGLSAGQLAALAKTSQATITRLELGDRRLTPKWRNAIAEALGIPPEGIASDAAAPTLVKPKYTTSDGAMLILQINRRVTLDQANRIMAILEEGQ